jgi:hypothetical protein
VEGAARYHRVGKRSATKTGSTDSRVQPYPSTCGDLGATERANIIFPPTYDDLFPFAPNISVRAILKLTVLEIAMDPTIWMRSFFDPPPPMADANLTWVGDRGPDGKRVFFLHIKTGGMTRR